jgi:hypothetical protein
MGRDAMHLYARKLFYFSILSLIMLVTGQAQLVDQGKVEPADQSVRGHFWDFVIEPARKCSIEKWKGRIVAFIIRYPDMRDILLLCVEHH